MAVYCYWLFTSKHHVSLLCSTLRCHNDFPWLGFSRKHVLIRHISKINVQYSLKGDSLLVKRLQTWKDEHIMLNFTCGSGWWRDIYISLKELEIWDVKWDEYRFLMQIYQRLWLDTMCLATLVANWGIS